MMILRPFLAILSIVALPFSSRAKALAAERITEDGVTTAHPRAAIANRSEASSERDARLHRRSADDFPHLPRYPFGNLAEPDWEPMAKWLQSGAFTSTCVCRSAEMPPVEEQALSEEEAASRRQKLDEAYADKGLTKICENKARQELFGPYAADPETHTQSATAEHVAAARWYNTFGWAEDRCHCYTTRTLHNRDPTIMVDKCKAEASTEATAAMLFSHLGVKQRGPQLRVVPYLPPAEAPPLPPETSPFMVSSSVSLSSPSRGFTPAQRQLTPSESRARLTMQGIAATADRALRRGKETAAVRLATARRLPQTLRHGLGRVANHAGERLAEGVRQGMGQDPGLTGPPAVAGSLLSQKPRAIKPFAGGKR